MVAEVLQFKRGRGRPPGSLNKKTMAQNEPLRLNRTNETDAQIATRITKTFTVMDKVTNGLISGNILGAVISGAAGVGKSHTIETALEAAQEEGHVTYNMIKGSSSAVGLYMSLYNNLAPDTVLVLDDCDSIFYDMEALNVLKAVLDTKKRRVVSWNKESPALMRNEIPNEFEYEGRICIITNIDLAWEIEKNGKFGRHYSALLSRSLYVDLGIHSKREVMVRIKQVVFSDAFRNECGLNKTQINTVLDWINNNLAEIRDLSIRTVLQLGAMLKTSPDWEEMAEVTMLKRS